MRQEEINEIADRIITMPRDMAWWLAVARRDIRMLVDEGIRTWEAEHGADGHVTDYLTDPVTLPAEFIALICIATQANNQRNRIQVTYSLSKWDIVDKVPCQLALREVALLSPNASEMLRISVLHLLPEVAATLDFLQKSIFNLRLYESWRLGYLTLDASDPHEGDLLEWAIRHEMATSPSPSMRQSASWKFESLPERRQVEDEDGSRRDGLAVRLASKETDTELMGRFVIDRQGGDGGLLVSLALRRLSVLAKEGKADATELRRLCMVAVADWPAGSVASQVAKGIIEEMAGH